MKKQNGGLKLKNSGKTGFKPVYDMINSLSGRLDLLTYKSLKGFMISLDVASEDSEYMSLNTNRQKFTKVVTSFILKFAIITLNNDEALPPYKGINKSSESKDSYFDEAKLQQLIWKKSIIGGRPEICPPVANFSLFDNDNSKELLRFLQGKTTGSSKEIFDYLFDCVNSNATYEIGIITMPKVENSTTFGDFIDATNGTHFHGIRINTEYKNMAYACVGAQIVRLFIDIGVIHFDLHSGNALIYLTPNNEIKCLLIDFGRASNIMSETGDDYLSYRQKQEIMTRKQIYYDSFITFATKEDSTEAEKENYIKEALDYIARTDLEINQTLFAFSRSDSYQMDWYESYPPAAYKPAFEMLKKSIITIGISITDKTIKSYEESGNLIDFSGDVASFIVPFPGAQPCDSVRSICPIMGGRKNKKTRKTRKTRKNKKQIKTRRKKTKLYQSIFP